MRCATIKFILLPLFLILGYIPSFISQSDAAAANNKDSKIFIKKAYMQRKALVKDFNANNNNFKFLSSETLIYKISYLNLIKAGTAVLSATPVYYHNKKVMELKAEANSANWLKLLYHVNDVTISFFSKTNLYPYFLIMVRHEGPHNDFMEEKINGSKDDLLNSKEYGNIVLKAFKDSKFTEKFYKDKKYSEIALMKDKIDAPFKPFISYKDTQDALSALYYLRMLNLKKGGSYYIPVYENRKRYIVLVKALGYYEIKTPAGNFNCIELKAYLNFKGVFNHKGSLKIYVTQSPEHTPVYLVTKIPIGFMTAVLIKEKF